MLMFKTVGGDRGLLADVVVSGEKGTGRIEDVTVGLQGANS